MVSIVIPAHNEEAVIARCLSSFGADPAVGDFEVIVVVNGSTDQTAQRARSAAPWARVIEIEKASKVAALNAGDAAASSFPRVYLDADVQISAGTLRALGRLLGRHDGPLVAAPRMVVDTTASSWAVRAHYRVWALSEYLLEGHIGSGVFALSAEGRSRFEAFPDLIADDRYVQQLFARSERGSLSDQTFTITAPRTMRGLITRSVRASAGVAQLVASGQEGVAAGSSQGASRQLVTRVLRRPSLWPAFVVYCYAYAAPRLLARRKIARGLVAVWDRDETSRA